MKKVVKQTGGSLGIIFNREDRIIYGIEEGDIIDLGDIVNENANLRKELKEEEGNGQLGNS